MTFQELRDLGLNLIPCQPQSKKPKVDWKLYQDSICTLPLHDNENAAIICGKSSGNLVVIDIDVPEKLSKFFPDFELIKSNTLVTETGSGGYHVCMRAVDELPGIMRMVDELGNPMGEIRGQGGYVIAPGSIHPDTKKPYKIISSTTKIAEFNVKNLLESLAKQGINVKKNLPLNEILTTVPVGNRDDATFRLAAILVSGGLSYEQVIEEVKIWSERLGFAKFHKSAVDSAWKRANRPSSFPTCPEETSPKSLKSLSTKDEGKEIEIEALVAATGDYQTVTIEQIMTCNKCDIVIDYKGNGYENPKIKSTCSKCGGHMELTSIKTNDIMDLMLEEFSEEIENGKLINYDAKVFGKDVKTTFDNQRKRIIATYKSITNEDKKTNNPVLMVRQIENIDEPINEKLTPEEFEKYKLEAKTDMSKYLKRLSRSYYPKIAGDYDDPKLLILMFLVFGSEGTIEKIQGSMLFIGNPGQGKSELLKKVKVLSHKGAYVVGVTSSAAGMASGMVKLANGTSVVRPGVLPRHTGGHVAADEFDKFKPEDRKALLESMSQGTVTLIKSGVEEQRKAETGILAGCNPKYGTWDWSEEDPLDNINLESYTLQRFDFLWNFIGRDDIEEGKIAASILKMSDSNEEKIEIIPENELRKLLNSARDLKPQLKESATKMIYQYYMKARKKTSDKDTLPMDRRQLEGLIRASGMIAKLQLKDMIEECDVQEVIRLHTNSLSTFGINTKGDIRQMNMVDNTNSSKEAKFGKVFSKIFDEKNHFDQKEFKHESINEGIFRDSDSFDKYWRSHMSNNYLSNGDGTYRLTNDFFTTIKPHLTKS